MTDIEVAMHMQAQLRFFLFELNLMRYGLGRYIRQIETNHSPSHIKNIKRVVKQKLDSVRTELKNKYDSLLCHEVDSVVIMNDDIIIKLKQRDTVIGCSNNIFQIVVPIVVFEMYRTTEEIDICSIL